ncbi:MerR family transcriptional regulator [Streptosporangium sp. NPDC050855]|uniref:MerR family transcriptional regulator n=1 Tax=Streptosporangium sp. NPDC050855 TaxID=3366194 RepID=UPI0037A1348D
MLSIGEFANLTGLSVKALHHYDEKGVLVPAEVDDGSRYRRYSESQVRAGATVRVLRDAGVPLPRIADALRDGDVAGTLARHREEVLSRRAAEDAAHTAAELAVTAYAAPVDVTRRRAAAQPYVARVLLVGVADDTDAGNELANELFGELFTALHRDGLGPAGPFWTTIQEGPGPETVRLLCCWPTREPVPEGWGGEGVVTGELPARTELVASWRPAGNATVPEGVVHPAVVGLFEAVAGLGVDLRDAEIRQRVVGTGTETDPGQVAGEEAGEAGHDEDDVTVEVAVTIGS